MTINCFWDDVQENMYRIELSDTWTWDEFIDTATEAFALIGALDYDVNIVLGFYSKLPKGRALQHLTFFGGNQPPNLRHTVMLNQSGLATGMFIESIIGAVLKVRKWQGPKFVSSIEEARDHFESLQADDS